MGNTEVLLTNVTMREANVDKIYVLNKVKALMTIPKTDFVTGQMVADYYEVTYDAIKKVMMRHRDELLGDGVRCMTAKDFQKGHDVTFVLPQRNATHFVYTDGIEFDVPHRGMMIYPRRAVLRIGMLLRDSEIAKAVRTVLLDTEEKTQVVTTDHSDLLAVITKQTEQIDKLISLVETLVPMVKQNLPMGTPSKVVAMAAVVPEPICEKAPHQIAINTKQPSWYDEINALVRRACAVTQRNRNAVLCETYKRMDKQYGLCLNQYNADYKREKGCKASMLETVHWMETIKNPVTEGIMAGVLESMIAEKK